ncbi:MAG: glutathione S-transferase N-terminal domain-containing protein [Burkholderiaceae bacterium]
MTLYGYFRSSASFRVRIALNLKGLPFEYAAVHLLKGGGQQFDPSFRSLSADALVPVLQHDTHVLTQSLAIIEYLEETFPKAPLLPVDAVERAYVRSLAQMIACEIHPLNNLRVLRYLVRTQYALRPVANDAAEAAYKTLYRQRGELNLRVVDLGPPSSRPVWGSPPPNPAR